MTNYLIVLFKNKKKKKIINKFVLFERADRFFQNQIKNSNEIIFEKEVVGGKISEFELGLIQVGKQQDSRIYLKDEFGRNTSVKIDDNNMSIVKISPIKVEELFFDCQTNKKISIDTFIKKYLRPDGVKMISGLNNKVVLQIDDNFNLFSFKNESETNRFLDCLTYHFFKIKRGDCIIVKDTSKAQRKYLYELLVTKGFEKQFLYRKFTSAPLS